MDREKLSKFKQKSIASLLVFLDNDKDWLEASVALAELGNSQGVEAVINALENPDET